MKKYVLYFAIPFFLTACGESKKFDKASGTITQAVAAANISTMTSGATINFTSPTNKPSARGEDNMYAACTTKTPTTTTDADSDQISTQTRVYACKDISFAGRAITYSQNGTATIVDKDDNDAKSGWKFSYDITGGHSQGETWEYKGFWELTKATTSFTYDSDYKGTSTNTRSGTYVGGGTWSHTVTPTDMNNPFTGGGDMNFSGFYAYTFTVDGTQTQYVFKMSSSGLKYGATPCTNFFKEGSYTYTDASNNTISVTHTSCTARTVKFNDTTLP